MKKLAFVIAFLCQSVSAYSLEKSVNFDSPVCTGSYEHNEKKSDFVLQAGEGEAFGISFPVEIKYTERSLKVTIRYDGKGEFQIISEGAFEGKQVISMASRLGSDRYDDRFRLVQMMVGAKLIIHCKLNGFR